MWNPLSAAERSLGGGEPGEEKGLTKRRRHATSHPVVRVTGRNKRWAIGERSVALERGTAWRCWSPEESAIKRVKRMGPDPPWPEELR